MNIVILIVSALVLLFIGFSIFRFGRKNRRLLIFLYVFLLILAARLVLNLLDPELEFNLFERIFDGIIRTFQSFTLDEDYTEALWAGEELLRANELDDWVLAYGVISSVLNVCAPLLGGALLLEVLASIFPRLRLFFNMRGRKLVFSELNEAAVCLAEDISRKMDDQKKNYKQDHRGKKTGKALFVFADVYKDEQSEAYSELVGRAEALGAVCLKTDPSAINLRRSKSVSYFLIDVDPIGNINGLSLLLGQKDKALRCWPSGKKNQNDEDEKATQIYTFVQTEIESNMVQKICRESGEMQNMVLVRSIRDYMNAAVNLMYDVPLFLPFLMDGNEQSHDDLTVTLLGAGEIAEEAFKAVFWCGQILGVQLHINVLSRQVETIQARIQESCPGLLESCRENSDKLKVFPYNDSKHNPPYSTEPVFHEIENAVYISDYPAEVLSETNYYIVALGSDVLNLKVSNSLNLELERRALTGDAPANVVVAPAVFDGALAKAGESMSPERFGIRIIPFAMNESRFSCRNVFMADFTQASERTAKRYSKEQQTKMQEDEYTYWANVARSVHAPYKLYSCGLLEPDQNSAKRYKIKPGAELPSDEKCLNALAWIEHRRWNAFMRSQGFFCPTREQYDKYYQYNVRVLHKKASLHKSIPLKYHPCLVESEVTPEPYPTDGNFDRSLYDYLDYVSFYDCWLEAEAEGRQLTVEDLQDKYKKWDYPEFDDALKLLLGTE